MCPLAIPPRRDKYKIKLRYPDLPCIAVGSRSKPECIPLKVCDVLPDKGAWGMGLMLSFLLHEDKRQGLGKGS